MRSSACGAAPGARALLQVRFGVDARPRRLDADATTMRSPACSARSCSSFSICSSEDGGIPVICRSAPTR